MFQNSLVGKRTILLVCLQVLSAQDPELLSEHPEFWHGNGQSLRLLESYLQGLFAGRAAQSVLDSRETAHWSMPTSGTKITLHLRSRHGRYHVVDLDLANYASPHAVVKNVLESCSLPTRSLPGEEGVSGS